MTFFQLVLAAFIFCFVIIPIVWHWIVGRIVQEDPQSPLTDAELQKLNEGFGRGNPPVVEPKVLPPFIRLAREQYPNIGIEDDDDIQIVAWRIVDWRIDNIEDRLNQLETANKVKPIKKRLQKKGGKR